MHPFEIIPPPVTEEPEPEVAEPFERLWTVREAAAFLSKSPSWVYRESASRRLPCRRIGRDLRFIPGELRAWVESQPGSL